MNDQVITVTDLFRYDSLRNTTILSTVYHILLAYQFNSSELMLNDYAANLYLNGVVIGTASIFSCLICFYVLHTFPRKPAMIALQAICLTLSLCLWAWFACLDPSECSEGAQLVQSMGLFLFRLLSSLTYFFFYVW